MKNKILILGVILAIAVLAFLLTRDSSGDKPGKITIAEGSQPIAAPIYVANAKGYFKDEGLNVELVPFASGKLCLDALIGGKADYATVAETPIMHASFKNQPIKIIATIHRSRDNTFCVTNKSKGIVNPRDLVGKTVAVPKGTNAEYAFSAFLLHAGLKIKEIENIKVLNLSPPEMAGAINHLDAVVAWQPHIGRCEKVLDSNAVVFSFDSVYEETYNLVTSELLAEKKQEICVKVLKAINKALDFIQANPEECIQIVAGRIGMDKAELTKLWPIYHFGLNLKNSLISTMTEEGKWAVESKQQEGKVPDMLEFVASKALMEISKDSVKIK